jgi:hypothetical protein
VCARVYRKNCQCVFNLALRFEDVWRGRSIAPSFLTVRCQIDASAPLPQKESHRCPLDRRLRPKADLDVPEREKKCPYCQSNHGPPARSPSLYRLSYPGSLYMYADGPGSIPCRAKGFPFSTASRKIPGPTQPPIHWVLVSSSARVKPTTHFHPGLRPRMVELYLHSLTCLQSLVLNY